MSTKRKNLWDNEYKRMYLKYKHSENRRIAIEMLGGKCSKCDFSDIRALQIDHIEGGGCKEIREVSSYTRYMWIRNNLEEAKKKYQILCANCNWIKRVENNEVMIGREKLKMETLIQH